MLEAHAQLLRTGCNWDTQFIQECHLDLHGKELRRGIWNDEFASIRHAVVSGKKSGKKIM
jgi:hypothetical protein